MEQLGVDTLLPLPSLVHQPHIESAQGPDLQDVVRRHPRLGYPVLAQQLAQVARVRPVGLGPLLLAPQRGSVRRLGEMYLDTGPGQLFGHEPPARAPLQRERHIGPVGQRFEPLAQVRPRGGTDLARADFTGLGVHLVECDLSSMHVKTTYDSPLGPPRVPDLANPSKLAVYRGGPFTCHLSDAEGCAASWCFRTGSALPTDDP